jgi:hypothetical protein
VNPSPANIFSPVFGMKYVGQLFLLDLGSSFFLSTIIIGKSIGYGGIAKKCSTNERQEMCKGNFSLKT